MSLSAHGTKEKESLEEYLSHDATDRIAKEQVKRAFESFRSSYDAMSHKLRISMKREQTLLEKCTELKSAVVLHAAKLKSASEINQMTDDSVQFYQNECEIAWKEAHVSKQRELEALGLIKEMKQEISTMKTQLLDLRDFENTPKQVDRLDTREPGSSANTPDTSSRDISKDECLSFEEWKVLNNVFTPACSKRMKASTSDSLLPTPGLKQTPTRWTSVQTPMERISSTLSHRNQ